MQIIINVVGVQLTIFQSDVESSEVLLDGRMASCLSSSIPGKVTLKVGKHNRKMWVQYVFKLQTIIMAKGKLYDHLLFGLFINVGTFVSLYI